MDNLEFLDAGEPANAKTQPETTTEAVEQPQQVANPTTDVPAEPETAEQKAARQRDERGRFKAKEQADDVMVPLKALHETRDEVKALKQQLAALSQPQMQPQAPQVPDIFENPEGYSAYIQSQIGAISLNDRLNLSEELVRQSAGEETVNAAQEWGRQVLASNPTFAQAFYAQRNPYGFLVKEYQRQQTFAKLGDDPTQIEAFLAWKQAQGGQQQPAQASHQQPTPRSIASATSAGGVQHQAMGPGVAFGNVIK